MALILQIENYDQIENGGPVSLRLDGKGASIGRRGAMDWVLPDPSRMISGHHFDIQFRDGGYWLVDVSMNGTFLQGQRHRLDAPRRLAGGEKLVVGHYVIAVTLEEPAWASPPPPRPPEPPRDAGPATARTRRRSGRSLGGRGRSA